VGVTLATAEFLAEAAAGGVCFECTLTVGRQSLFVGPTLLWPMLQEHGLRPSQSKVAFRRELGWKAWSDPFFQLLGASEVKAIDASDYQGASIIHDLNIPIPRKLQEQFDVVFDCGTLEHIFNAPVALKSYMEMVKVGGHLILVLPANNLFGHGFYQFSAELFYSALSEQNGYTVERMLICQEDSDAVYRFRDRAQVSLVYGPRYEVADPRVVGQRVTLQDDQPTMLMVQARRIARKPVFEPAPEQSDYLTLWDSRVASKEPLPANPPSRRLRNRLPPRVRNELVQPALLWLQWDAMPRLIPLLDPFARRRTRRERALSNPRLFGRIDR
jgi:SAM-dependent methyltransferase